MNLRELQHVLAKRRQDLQLTQRQVAKAMGTTQAAIHRLENAADLNVHLRTLQRWAAVLDVRLEYGVNIPLLYHQHPGVVPTRSWRELTWPAMSSTESSPTEPESLSADW